MPLTSYLQHLFWQQLLGRRQCDEFGKYQAELSEQVHGCNQPINSAHQLFHNLDQWTAPRQFYYSSLITWACRPTEGGRSRGWFPRSRSCPGNFSAPVALSQHCHTRRTNCVHYHVLEWMITFVEKITAGRGSLLWGLCEIHQKILAYVSFLDFESACTSMQPLPLSCHWHLTLKLFW